MSLIGIQPIFMLLIFPIDSNSVQVFHWSFNADMLLDGIIP